MIDGKELAANGQFKINAVKDVIISIESKDGSQYKVGGFKLTLVYNFANAKSVLTSMLSEATSKIYAEDEAGKVLLQEASSLATKVAAIADDNEDSYAKYIEYGLYAETLEESAIYNEIAEFSKKLTLRQTTLLLMLRLRRFMKHRQQLLLQLRPLLMQ